MTVTSIGVKANYIGLSTDTKPSPAPAGALFREKDTGALFVYTGSVWVSTNTFSGAVDMESYYDVKKISAPSNPSSGYGRFYVKAIDSSNDGLFCLIKKGGSFVEVQVF